MGKVRRNYMVGKEQDDLVSEKADEWGIDKSFIVRRALKYYLGEAYKRDKMLKKKIKGEI